MDTKTRVLERPAILQQKPKPEECEHTFKRYKDTIVVDNARYAVKYGTHAGYFIVRACTKCKLKQYMAWVKE